MHNFLWIWAAVAAAGMAAGCGGESDGPSNGTGGAAASAATGGTGAQSTGAASGASGDAGCGDGCGFGMTCCNAVCRNLANDPINCGSCGLECPDEAPACGGGDCVVPPCDTGNNCDDGLCCGSNCCRDGQLCCAVETGGPVDPDGGLGCFEPENGTCPIGCLGCDCAAPDTPVATPQGPRPMAELRPGDLVYSVEHEAVVVVPVASVVRRPAAGHVVPEVTLDSGATLRISAQHPTANGSTMGQLRPGDRLGEASVRSVRLVTYGHDHTYDILPDSTTGYYFVAGALIGSTLGGEAAVCE